MRRCTAPPISFAFAFLRLHYLKILLIAFYYVRFFADPVEARDSGENFTVAGGEARRFTCPVDGNPEPNIEWYSEKTGRKISSGKELEARETGCYTCVASNSLGTPVNITQCLIVGN